MSHFITMDRFSAVSCTFFNLLYASLCSEDNLAFHTERDSSTLSAHLRCKHILCSWSYLWQLSIASLFIQIISPLIPTNDWDALWEKPAGTIVGINANWNISIHPKQYFWSRSYRSIIFSNKFLAPRFDFITINCFTKPCFRRWCLDDTLDFWGVCERLRRVEIQLPELNLVIQLAFSFR